MTDPDDDWGDLARELGVQKPTASAADASPPEEVEEPEPIHELHATTPDEEPEFADGIADEAAPNDDADPEGEGEGDAEDATGDKQPGDGRKRRRRRRRRKKGDGDAADAGIADEPAPSYQAAGRAPVAVAAPVAAVEPAGDDAEGEDGEAGGPVSPAEEDTAGEVLRELIATWNVPSWDEIITGLHR
jgi:ribonuclease E